MGVIAPKKVDKKNAITQEVDQLDSKSRRDEMFIETSLIQFLQLQRSGMFLTQVVASNVSLRWSSFLEVRSHL